MKFYLKKVLTNPLLVDHQKDNKIPHPLWVMDDWAMLLFVHIFISLGTCNFKLWASQIKLWYNDQNVFNWIGFIRLKLSKWWKCGNCGNHSRQKNHFKLTLTSSSCFRRTFKPGGLETISIFVSCLHYSHQKLKITMEM